MRRFTRAAQAGDTIVEVLICIAIVAVVITGAFVVTNNSSQSVQDSSEHSQAELHLQSQVESLKQYLANGGPTPGVQTYCMRGTTLITINPGNTSCTITNGGAAYKQSFTQTGNVYTFRIEWDSSKGGVARASYVYRVYPNS